MRIFSGSFTQFHTPRNIQWISGILTGQEAVVPCLPNRYNTPFMDPGPFERDQCFKFRWPPLPTETGRSVRTSSRSRKTCYHPLKGRSLHNLRWSSSHYRALSPEPLQGFQVGDGEGVQSPELAISLSRTLSRAGLEPRSPKGPDR